MAVITFPKILTDRLTDEGAKALADMFNTVENSAQKITLEIAEERFEKRVTQVETRLDAKIDMVAARLDAKIDTVAARLDAKIDKVAAGLDAKIDKVAAETRAELIKWMFIFWAGQVGVLFAFFKH